MSSGLVMSWQLLKRKTKRIFKPFEVSTVVCSMEVLETPYKVSFYNLLDFLVPHICLWQRYIVWFLVQQMHRYNDVNFDMVFFAELEAAYGERKAACQKAEDDLSTCKVVLWCDAIVVWKGKSPMNAHTLQIPMPRMLLSPPPISPTHTHTVQSEMEKLKKIQEKQSSSRRQKRGRHEQFNKKLDSLISKSSREAGLKL